ncbi:MAG: hypothetical protein EAZ47_09570 [Bacteroidetes bacterium]|nr:MAG: hypothetical protein EAZ47_09570 [Bacteroidota bacterium]
MKIIHIIILFASICCQAFASDSVNIKPILNIYFERSVGQAFYIKLPHTKAFHLDRKNFMSLKRHYYQFTQLQLADTGTLSAYFFHGFHSFMYPGSNIEVEKNGELISITIPKSINYWLYISESGALNKMKAGITLLTPDEFEIQHPKAYKRFLKRGFTHVISNVAVNTVPLRKEPD